MILNFKPKIGQLVQWDNPEISNDISKMGIITDIIAEYYVEVTFIQNNWIIRLSTRSLTLINDVED